MVLTTLVNASLNSSCSWAKHNLKVLSVFTWSAMLITKVMREQSLFKTINFNEFFQFHHFGLIDVFIISSLSVLIHCELFWYWEMSNTGIFQQGKWSIIHCSMKTNIIGMTITSETVSQNTVSGETKEPVTVRLPEIATKLLIVTNKDKEQTNDDEGSVKRRENEIEQTGKILIKAREAYFNLIQTKRKKMAHTKRTAKKRTIREYGGKPEERRLQVEAMDKRSVEKPRKSLHQFRPGTRALLEIRKFQISTHLLIQKRPFYKGVKEVLQAEKPWFKIQATAILAIHGQLKHI